MTDRQDPLFRFGHFNRWALKEIDQYIARYQSKQVEIPERGRPFAPIKQAAAIWNVIYGKKSKGLLLSDIMDSVGQIDALPGSPSLRVLEQWRYEKRFRETVEGLKWEYAKYAAEGILFGSDEFLPWFHPLTSLRRLRGKIFLIREALAYDPDMIDRISIALGGYREVEKHPDIPYTPLSELAYCIWCAALLNSVKQKTITPRKKRALRDILPKMPKMVPGDNKWLPPEEYLLKEDLDEIALVYRQQIGQIIKYEKTQPDGADGLTKADKDIAINFLAGRYRFDPTELEVDEDWELDEGLAWR